MRSSAVVAPLTSVARIFDAVGADEFEPEMLRFLRLTCGLDHYTVYQLHGIIGEVIGGASMRGRHYSSLTTTHPPKWHRTFPDLVSARMAAEEAGGPVVVHMTLAEITDPDLHQTFFRYDIVDRVLICGQRLDQCYAVSLLRAGPSGPFSKTQLVDLLEVADMVISAFAKHATLVWDRPDATKGFASVELIEARLRSASRGLSTRELQVSARILYGISTVGIALDLNLGEDTVATYRKRAYQRLGISSRHELFKLYLTLL